MCINVFFTVFFRGQTYLPTLIQVRVLLRHVLVTVTFLNSDGLRALLNEGEVTVHPNVEHDETLRR